jgi:hypothetical protein
MAHETPLVCEVGVLIGSERELVPVRTSGEAEGRRFRHQALVHVPVDALPDQVWVELPPH